jgi:hypothetical protein
MLSPLSSIPRKRARIISASIREDNRRARFFCARAKLFRAVKNFLLAAFPEFHFDSGHIARAARATPQQDGPRLRRDGVRGAPGRRFAEALLH